MRRSGDDTLAGLMASHGRYTILGKLADGGMAEIFLAVQHGRGGLREARRPQADPDRILRGPAVPQHAARRGAHLDEPPAQQHRPGAGSGAGGRALLPGARAGRRLGSGASPAPRARGRHASWPRGAGPLRGGRVCRALAYAHAKRGGDGKPLGIVHRDVSPNNVLISDQGEVKLADFGIAKAERKREQTAAGVIKGKVAYMSPEQAIGGRIDARSDIFSAGVDAVPDDDGRRPFEAGERPGVAASGCSGASSTPPEKAKPTVGPGVASIIMRAMRLDPERALPDGGRDAARTSSGSLRTSFTRPGRRS